jgi:nitroreductase
VKVSEAVASRRSIRAFLDRPVDPDLLRDILERAARAPSGGNLQPWHLHVLAGQAMARFRALMAVRVAEAPMGEGAEYAVYPPGLGEPYRTRRWQVGEVMYESLGIGRGERDRRLAQFAHNFRFFDAPVGLFCFVDRGHGPPQWADCGMVLQNIMLLLREAGLDSCPQEAWAMFPKTVAQFVGAPAEQMLFTGMAIGWRDPAAPVNLFPVPRAPLDDYATFHA